MTHRILARLGRIGLVAVVGAMLQGCAMAPAAMGPFSGIQEVKTRAEVERQASHDPFPSPDDVGLK